MSTLRKAIQGYVEMRRNLGFKLHDAQIGLLKFASFLEKHNACHITLVQIRILICERKKAEHLLA